MTPLFIAIAGGSASGKTTLARSLVAALAPDAAVLSLDGFYRDLGHLPLARRAGVNFDRPQRIDWPLFLRTLDSLGRGRATRVPVYDFRTHTRCARSETLACPRFVVLDGLWLLRRREVRRRCALGIYVECPARERLRRRLVRDIGERGRSRIEVLRRWRDFVEPAYRRYVSSQAERADVVLRSPCSEETVARLVQRIRELPDERRRAGVTK